MMSIGDGFAIVCSASIPNLMERKLVLEIKTGACGALAEAPDAVSSGSRYNTPVRLPDEDSR